MLGHRPVDLVAPPKRPVRGAVGEAASWEGVDRELFEALRGLRRSMAAARGVPAYVVFGDATLREMARLRPSDSRAMLEVKGVGDRKLEEYGEAFLEVIVDWERNEQA